MKSLALLIPAILAASCAEIKNTNPDGSSNRATFLGTNVAYLKLPDGTEMKDMNNSLAFREGTRLVQNTVAGIVAADVAKTLSDNSIAVDQESVRAGVATTKIKSDAATRQLGIKEASKVKQAELKAAEAIVP